ncbi:hypothetical protein [Glaciimonas sp. PCH181]|uniref:hypothetical protein n=1 Tax=Glaciimonas sp. PCH181 TaxID=2133943 RepID=UPI000D359E21|nr:hypothetical protein [Glaciimonas sp. PCH181]PUA19585.1 hypothetical protein C7W93_06995 [Glaciimonas sp. PCH181]
MGTFTNSEKVDIRRFCGFQGYGSVPVQAFGARFSAHYGTLEFRLNNYAPEEEAVIRTTYLTNLYTLETAIFGAGANLDTDQAAVWTHNKREVADRTGLFNQVRRELCAFIGIPPGPGMASSGGSISLIV